MSVVSPHQDRSRARGHGAGPAGLADDGARPDLVVADVVGNGEGRHRSSADFFAPGGGCALADGAAVMFDVRCPVSRLAALVRGCGCVSCARAGPSRASCTWEERDRAGQETLFLEIPRFLGVRQGRLTGSHVRTGGSAHMGEMHRRSPKPVFRMIPRFCPERVANERLTSLDPAPGCAVGRPSAPPASGARMLRARGATPGVPGDRYGGAGWSDRAGRCPRRAGRPAERTRCSRRGVPLPRACRETGRWAPRPVGGSVAAPGVPGDRGRAAPARRRGPATQGISCAATAGAVVSPAGRGPRRR